MSTVIGKYVMENLTSGMYDDSKMIIREYIQNSADQIDKAIDSKILLPEEAEIHITLDSIDRQITIFDNATGIEKDRARPVLQNIAISEKDRTKDKGFRGIGRLGGLAYCKTLIFTTSFKGEDIKSILKWDAKKLRDIVHDHKTSIEAAKLIDEVVEFTQVPCDPDDHFFQVDLIEINKENKELLSFNDIKLYLSMVAPLPYDSKFLFINKIRNYIDTHSLKIDEYKIYLNDEQLFKGYRSKIYSMKGNKKVTIDQIHDIEIKEFYNDDDTLLAWMWFGLSNFNQAIPKSCNPQRGLRYRKENIQIGDETTLNSLHKESRGNNYFIGEIHAVHTELIPSGRRDIFEENIYRKKLEYKLIDFFHNRLYKLYHDANRTKNALKRIQEEFEVKEDFKEKMDKGFTDDREEKQFIEKIKKAEEESKKAKKQLELIETKTKDDTATQKVIKSIKKDFEKVTKNIPEPLNHNNNNGKKYRTQKLSKLTKKEQKLLSKVFSIIDKTVTPDVAETIKEKIEEEFK